MINCDKESVKLDGTGKELLMDFGFITTALVKNMKKVLGNDDICTAVLCGIVDIVCFGNADKKEA